MLDTCVVDDLPVLHTCVGDTASDTCVGDTVSDTCVVDDCVRCVMDDHVTCMCGELC